MKTLIFIVGMPGTGKTTIGKRLAKIMNYSFEDLDVKIEKMYNSNINSIFQTKGERYFRRMENICFLRLINESNNPTIISCGGGTPIFHDNLTIMKNSGIIVGLSAGKETLIKRLYDSPRPIFADCANVDEATQKITRMINQREKYYNVADIRCSTDRISTKTVQDLHRQILEQLERLNW